MKFNNCSFPLENSLWAYFRFVIEGLGTTCSVDLHPVDFISRAYIIFILFFGFIFPLIIIFFSYCRVCSILLKSALFRQQTKLRNQVERSGEGDPISQAITIETYNLENFYLSSMNICAGYFYKCRTIFSFLKRFVQFY